MQLNWPTFFEGIYLDLTSIFFLFFVLAVGLLSYFTPRKIRYIWLLACSYLFYWFSPESPVKNLLPLALLVGATLFSYWCALVIELLSSKALKRLFMLLPVLAGIGMLVLFKYYDFFAGGIETLAGGSLAISRPNLLLPLGISYYTMQSIAYVCDVYNGTCPAEKNPLRYALFVSFFPGITGGPINRAASMLPQYKEPAAFSYNRVAGGLFRMLWGYFKFHVVAANIDIFTRTVFEKLSLTSGPAHMLAALLYAYQVYINFSGCCDIGIGAAYALGFDFMENFNRPFAAKTFADLWKRWHISLTTFFRDFMLPPPAWDRWKEKHPRIGGIIS